MRGISTRQKEQAVSEAEREKVFWGYIYVQVCASENIARRGDVVKKGGGRRWSGFVGDGEIGRGDRFRAPRSAARGTASHPARARNKGGDESVVSHNVPPP